MKQDKRAAQAIYLVVLGTEKVLETYFKSQPEQARYAILYTETTKRFCSNS